MRISILLLAMLCVCLPFAAYAQPEASDSLQGDNGKDGDLDAKNDDPAAAGENEKDKPRKKTFTEERFEKLFNNRYRSKPRLLTPKYHEKPKPKLPSFIKKPPSVKPLGQDGLPVDDEPRPARTTPQTKPVNSRSSRTSTTTPSSRSRGRASTSTTTQRPSLSDSNRRFNLSNRGRGTDTSSSNPATSRGRGRIN